MVTRAREIQLEASAWLALLKGEDRSEATEAGFQAWLAADPDHARAFERVTETWESLPGAAALLEAAPSRTHRPAPTRRRTPAQLPIAAALAAVVAAVALWAGLARDPVYATAVGQQHSVTLEDGSRITLNTDTRVRVHYDSGERRVRLDRGEALFEVAKNPARPFLVTAGDETVRALGTVFMVRRADQAVAVTLLEGRVSVAAATHAEGGPPTVLTPGQRLTVRADVGSALDRPELDAATAWRRGQAVFDGASLIDAASELNRYGGRKLVIGDPALAGLKVSGSFATSDTAEFAAAVARLYGLGIENQGDRIVLVKRAEG